MVSFDLQRMLIGDFPFTFLLEVAVRVSAAFLAVFFFLKFSGRRGIRQLSRFELVVILTLGSAAGDVTFMKMYRCCRWPWFSSRCSCFTEERSTS